MGTQQSRNSVTSETCQALSSYTQEDMRILEWRSNPEFSQFIPRVTFQCQQTQKTGNFIDQCQRSQNLPLNIRHQKFVGNLTVLAGKLNLEETLYVLKSLLSGHEIILGFFGKTLVSPSCCFLTKEGAVKAWINEDYRLNKFSFGVQGEDFSDLDSQRMFLKPQKWVDHQRPSSSPANIIQKILFEVAQLTYQQAQFNSFLESLDTFIHGNILKNFNFDRVKKFLNKYIYKRKIFVKSSLLEVIQKLYYESIEKNGVFNRSAFCRQSAVERRPTQMSMIREEREPLSFEISPFLTKKNLSPIRRNSLQESSKMKYSEFFSSTAYTNSHTNQSSKIQNRQKEGPLYGSYCPSQIEGQQLYDSIQIRTTLNRNQISPQFSMNYCTETVKVPASLHKKQPSMISNQQNSSILSNLSSKSSIKLNKTVEFKPKESDLKIIYERKETDPSDRCEVQNRARAQCARTSIMNQRQHSMSVQHSFRKNQKFALFRTNDSETNKQSNISIALKADNFIQNNRGKLFQSDCSQNQKDNLKSVCFEESMKTSGHKQQFLKKNGEPMNNFFTMKTITKLISSNQNISEQHQSEGDFPSNQNISNYSGILATMGRSAVIMDVPDSCKPQFKTNKIQEPTFISNRLLPHKTGGGPRPYDVFLK